MKDCRRRKKRRTERRKEGKKEVVEEEERDEVGGGGILAMEIKAGAFCHLCETSHSSIPFSANKKRLLPEISSFSSAAKPSGCEGTEKLTN